MPRNPSSRKYLLTINNPCDHGFTHERIRTILNEFSGLRYFCMCDEVGEQGTPHTHVYVVFGNSVMFDTLHKRFYGVHIDKARADVNGGLLVSDKLRRAIEHCRLIDTDNPIHIEELQLRLKSEGYNSFSEVAADLGNTMRRIGSPKLGTPTGTSGNVYNLNP